MTTPSPRSNRKYCIASNCSATSYRSATPNSFFTLPKEADRRREWLTTIGREDLLSKKDLNIKGYLVCSAHFDEDSIKIMRQLKSDAVPNKCLPAPECGEVAARDDAVADRSTQIKRKVKLWTDTILVKTAAAAAAASCDSDEDDQISLQEHAARARSERLIKKRKQEEAFSEEGAKESKKLAKTKSRKNSTDHDPEDEISKKIKMLKEWINEIICRFNGNVNDAEYKIFALNFYISCPQSYKILQTVLKLPSKSTLDKMKIYIPAELDERVLNLLSLKLESLPVVAKYCSLCIEEKVLRAGPGGGGGGGGGDGGGGGGGGGGAREPRAYAATLQGLFAEWRQPVAHTFLPATPPYTELDDWINGVITMLFGIGVEVKAIISHQNSIFDSFAKTTKKITVDEPYFYVDDHKIFYIFDAPFLLKGVRNCLVSSDLYFDGDVISFEHITALANDQKERNLRLTPKITDVHVEQRNLKKVRVKHAAQTFSAAVHAALETYISFGRMPRKAKATAQFVKTMNDLFDVLNSGKVKCQTELRNPLTMSQSQRTVLEHAENMFARMQSVNRITGKDNTKSLKSLHNFQITIQGVQQLFEEMKQEEEGLGGLATRRLQAAAARAQLLGALRLQCGSSSPPTRTQFTMAFSKLFSKNLLKESPEASREEDILEILNEAEYFMNIRNPIL